MAKEVRSRLGEGHPLDGLGLGVIDGRVDLRGLPAGARAGRLVAKVGNLEARSQVDAVKLEGRELARLDLSGADLSGWRFRDASVTDCRFQGARCRQWVLWGSVVDTCDFTDADLRECLLGTYVTRGRDEWLRATFRGADMRGAGAHCAAWRECDFSDARLDGFNFNQCEFERCTFAGPLNEVLFDGRDLPPRWPGPPDIDADFRSAYFTDVEFRGYPLARACLPEDPDLFLVPHFRCVAERVLETCGEGGPMEEQQLRAVMANALKGLGACKSGAEAAAWVFNRRDWRAWGGDRLMRLAEEAVVRAVEECRG